jgi:restriction endonuclease S subunit
MSQLINKRVTLMEKRNVEILDLQDQLRDLEIEMEMDRIKDNIKSLEKAKRSAEKARAAEKKFEEVSKRSHSSKPATSRSIVIKDSKPVLSLLTVEIVSEDRNLRIVARNRNTKQVSDPSSYEYIDLQTGYAHIFTFKVMGNEQFEYVTPVGSRWKAVSGIVKESLTSL